MNKNRRIQRCFWKNGELHFDTGETIFSLDSASGIKALKANRVVVPAETGTSSRISDEIPIFEPDSPRRMTLIQEKISGLRD